MSKILGIIPSRYASTRFPGKPLIDIDGKTMIQRVYEQAAKSQRLEDLIVATDDDRIAAHVRYFGGKVKLTAEKHQNGTERCGEVVSHLTEQYDFIINIQGDEPFISPNQIDLLADSLSSEIELATLVKQEKDISLFEDPNIIKVVFSKDNLAHYFSRSPIPLFKNKEDYNGFYKHIGIYAYRTDVLQKINQLPPSSLELAESLEQLRWLENGYKINVVETLEDSHSIDAPEDLEHVLRMKSVQVW